MIPSSLEPLIITPLGGLGEFGMNMMAYQYADAILVVDCGLVFPDAEHPGVDLIIPETQFLADNLENIQGFILTHGHEDHIGALPYVWPDIPVPIYGTAMTLGLVSNKFLEHKLLDQAQLREIKPRERLRLGPFDIQFIHVTHSIVDACALAITTPVGTVIHTGDFKIDHTPVDGRVTDLSTLAKLGEDGVLALLSDSTNVDVPGASLSERAVRDTLFDLLPEAMGLVVVTTFSSHIPRIQQLIDTAVAVGRKVVLNGRSMLANVQVARTLGFLRITPGTLVDIKDFPYHRRNELMVISTGSQGEPNSSLVRIALKDHKEIQLVPDDMVIFSSRIIPGNERSIGFLVNLLSREGVRVILPHQKRVHVSGHAPREDLKLMMAITRPQFFIPIHGEVHQLHNHRNLALEMGIPRDRTMVIENGEQVLLDGLTITRAGRVPSGRVLVDGKGIGDISDIVMRDRRNLSEFGFVVAVMVVEKNTGEMLQGPELLARGVFHEEESEEIREEARLAVMEGLHAGPEALGFGREEPELKDQVVRALRRFFKKRLGRRPVILPIVLEM